MLLLLTRSTNATLCKNIIRAFVRWWLDEHFEKDIIYHTYFIIVNANYDTKRPTMMTSNQFIFFCLF